ncbi:MAG: LysR family transcriptional regulator [Sulfobacillus acidophilus]|uniref:LysR family transcriptional regulator n=1 Tax=Sulfobacillus acidophilus TaxID=53633 RepID=A0A2T2WLK0_9FIRM|nr:MAG: LysR family transcriptional regulator [Sulfobacillus acidophilus]
MNESTLDRYRIFDAVVRAGSFTRASEWLFLSQPAVSQAIKKLERDLGTTLLIRTARGVRVTPEGQVLAAHLKEAFRHIEAGEQHVAKMHQLAYGEVRIGASDTLCRHYLLPTLDVFHRTYPHIRLHVTNRTSQETVSLLRAGHIDFGVVNLPLPSIDGLVVYEGPHLRDGFVVGQAYRRLCDRPCAPVELSRHPLLLLEQGSVIRRRVEEFFRVQGVDVVPEIELGSIDLLVEFARSGFGVACVIRDFVQPELEHGTLYEVLVTPGMPLRAAGLVVLRDVPLSQAAQTLLSQLRNKDLAAGS